MEGTDRVHLMMTWKFDPGHFGRFCAAGTVPVHLKLLTQDKVGTKAIKLPSLLQGITSWDKFNDF